MQDRRRQPNKIRKTGAGACASCACFFVEKVKKSVGNIDATIIAQRPKMAPYIPKIRENIANTLGLELNQVNIKATTEEGLGFTGSGDGISAQAVCILE